MRKREKRDANPDIGAYEFGVIADTRCHVTQRAGQRQHAKAAGRASGQSVERMTLLSRFGSSPVAHASRVADG